MGDGVQVVGVVVCIGVLDIHRILLQLHEQQGNSIHKTHDIGAAAVEVAVDFQLFDGQKVVVFRVLKVDDRRFLLLCPAAGALHSNGNAIPNQGILLLVDLHERGSGEAVLHLLLSLVQLSGGEPWIEPLEGLPKIPGEQNLLVAFPAKGTALAQLFRIVGKGHLPAQLPL